MNILICLQITFSLTSYGAYYSTTNFLYKHVFTQYSMKDFSRYLSFRGSSKKKPKRSHQKDSSVKTAISVIYRTNVIANNCQKLGNHRNFKKTKNKSPEWYFLLHDDINDLLDWSSCKYLCQIQEIVETSRKSKRNHQKYTSFKIKTSSTKSIKAIQDTRMSVEIHWIRFDDQ